MKKPNWVRKLERVELPGWAGTVLVWLIAGLLVALGALAIIGGVIFTLTVAVFLPSLVVALVTWFCWTYMEMGATYFDHLPKVWQHIPFLHFWAGWAAVMWIIRLIARATRPMVKKGSFKDELRDGSGLTENAQRKLHMRRPLD
ncbi:hypothetical protein hairong_062 [Pseudomonas phage hairong]|nr:hypothetical protein hairong_062 [Pseudomonas phage hairong]